jgi:membrane protein implicated in regulation of membrane protease activity
MPWWIWLAGGLGLASLELIWGGGELYLALLGAAALATGFVELFMPLPLWAQVFVFVTTGGLALLFARQRLSERLKYVPSSGPVDSLVGARVVALTDIAPNGDGKVELRGAAWSARNLGVMPIRRDRMCRVERVQGLTLWVREELE